MKHSGNRSQRQKSLLKGNDLLGNELSVHAHLLSD